MYVHVSARERDGKSDGAHMYVGIDNVFVTLHYEQTQRGLGLVPVSCARGSAMRSSKVGVVPLSKRPVAQLHDSVMLRLGQDPVHVGQRDDGVLGNELGCSGKCQRQRVELAWCR